MAAVRWHRNNDNNNNNNNNNTNNNNNNNNNNNDNNKRSLHINDNGPSCRLLFYRSQPMGQSNDAIKHEKNPMKLVKLGKNPVKSNQTNEKPVRWDANLLPRRLANARRIFVIIRSLILVR